MKNRKRIHLKGGILQQKTFCMAFALLMWLTVTAMTVPDTANGKELPGGRQLVTTIYELAPDEEPPEREFEKDGRLYQCVSVQKTEIPFEESRSITREIELETESAEPSEILKKLAPSISYSEDGYTGTLTYLPSSLQTQVKSYRTSHSTVTDTRVYQNLEHNDNSLLPQTVTKNGMTLRFAGVSWQEQGGGGEDGSLIPTSYTATVRYSAASSSKTPAGYVTHVTYSGLATKSGIAKVIYTITYIGTPVKPPFPWKSAIGAGGCLAACGAAAGCLFIRKHNRMKKEAHL